MSTCTISTGQQLRNLVHAAHFEEQAVTDDCRFQSGQSNKVLVIMLAPTDGA